ncbi:MAG: B12-binding domain-containing radical SAM protein [Deltaproteobacteria bacterium]|nr:MAG: B12-binding domain-containing radical SAM protein [Deltaproteobacteria bacterium]
MTENSLLPYIAKPGRYLGSEYNSSIKEHADCRALFTLIFPDMYEIGMSHQGLQILYHILNQHPDYLAERCFCPDTDVERLMREKGRRLTTLESARPLKSFDVLGITLPYELCYTNILTILDLAGIPFYQKDRQDEHPIILGGGSCSMNPEPVADFFDLILLGDGEEAILEIAALVARAKTDGLDREQLISLIEQVEGIYRPANYHPEYTSTGTIAKINSKKGTPAVKRRVLANLDRIDHLLHPIVPNAKIVHDRLGVEIARGCTRGCRFCQAGIIYRPVRERTSEQIMELAEEGIRDTGFDELSLLSLSTGDYSCLEHILPRLMDCFADSFVSVAMPSMRVGTLTEKIMEQIKRVRKTGFTLAPEAGSERMRRVINKGITEEALLETSEQAFAAGWKLIKLYFMIGLPTETDEDIDQIPALAAKTRYQGIKAGHGKGQIKVSVGTFVPKPHTPFQWHRQLSVEESRNRIFRIKDGLTKGCTLSYHDPKQSYLEGVFSRGDRRLAKLIETAWLMGARLDSWSEHFDLQLWRQAAEKIGLELDFYLRARDEDEILPWAHLASGVSDAFIKRERERAIKEIYTPDCRYNPCQKCGLCNFKTISPIVCGAKDISNQSGQPGSRGQKHSAEPQHIKYMVSYQRLGNICFLGHLEILQLMFRALKRAEIKTNFSQGFNPSPKISFGPALPVGTESLVEYFIMDLPYPLGSIQDTIRKLNRKLPPGLTVTDIKLHSGKLEQNTVSSYLLTFPADLSINTTEIIANFLKKTKFSIERTRKGKTRSINIRPLVKSLTMVSARKLETKIINRAGSPGIKPQEAVRHILSLTEDETLQLKIIKTAWQPLE